jgi:hypothetical protein
VPRSAGLINQQSAGTSTAHHTMSPAFCTLPRCHHPMQPPPHVLPIAREKPTFRPRFPRASWLSCGNVPFRRVVPRLSLGCSRCRRTASRTRFPAPAQLQRSSTAKLPFRSCSSPPRPARHPAASFVWGAVHRPLLGLVCPQLLNAAFGLKFAERLVEMHPADAGDSRASATQLLRDSLFRYPTLRAAAAVTACGGAAWLCVAARVMAKVLPPADSVLLQVATHSHSACGSGEQQQGMRGQGSMPRCRAGV